MEDDQTDAEREKRDGGRFRNGCESGGVDVVGAEAWAGDDGFDGDAIDDQGAGEHGQADGALLILPGEIGGAGGVVGRRRAKECAADGRVAGGGFEHFVAELIAALETGTVDGELKRAAGRAGKDRDRAGPWEVVEIIGPGLAGVQEELAKCAWAKNEQENGGEECFLHTILEQGILSRFGRLRRENSDVTRRRGSQRR